MANQRPTRGSAERASRTKEPELTAAEAGQYGLRQVAELTGKDPEGVIGVEPAEDGWLVTVEVIEDRRIPSATDVLAAYETEISPDGELLSYRRLRRYSRGRGDDGTA
jgi:Gas vesicle synthesis protein GvpO